ncbi:hypothetical protein OK074_5120 [Actinobacteria bacterium OK074]|nr:hypothetical protein OK074_5120 [Actinobacteria bacterium OK074]
MRRVEDWSDCNDPAELREELARLQAENGRLRARLGATSPTEPAVLRPIADPVPVTLVPGANGLPYADASSGTEAKIALFRALFAGREDVSARRWVSSKSGRTGWSPAEDDPFDKSKDDADRVFWPLTDDTVYGHLDPSRQGRQELHIGLYPLLADDTCRLLACDFDGKDGSDWRGDATAYAEACQQAGVPALLEISRSGPCWRSHAPERAPTSGRSSPRASPPLPPAPWAWRCCGGRSTPADRWRCPATTVSSPLRTSSRSKPGAASGSAA